MSASQAQGRKMRRRHAVAKSSRLQPAATELLEEHTAASAADTAVQVQRVRLPHMWVACMCHVVFASARDCRSHAASGTHTTRCNGSAAPGELMCNNFLVVLRLLTA